MSNRDSSGKILLSFVTGLAAGAAAGLLLAPEPGDKNRERLKDQASDLEEEIEDKVKAQVERVKDSIPKGEANNKT